MLRNRLSLFIAIGTIILSSCQKNSSPTSVIGPLGDSAMVASAHPLSTQIGLQVLREGGNAFDAAVATHFALAVVYPRAGNVGGGGFALYRMKDGEIGSLDFREKAPARASRDMFLDEQGNIVDRLSIIGHKAAGVPGSVDGILKLYDQFGTKSLRELLAPAIDLATSGYAITQDQADEYNAKRDDFIQVNGPDFFLVKNEPWQEGDTVKYTELAGTLALIRDQGRSGFYEGIVADQIVKEMESGGGLISLDDLSGYSSKWRDPIVGNYRGYKVISMPPPSSGGVALLQLLQGSEKYDIPAMGHNTPETIHILTELERRVYADRATHLGDPDYYDVPVQMLLDPAYNKKRFSTIQKDKKTDSQDVKEGEVDIIESVQTTHFSIVDTYGNAVAITTTLNSYFGCKVYVDGAGFFLNNEMDDFSSKPGVPNQFGLIGDDANAIVPNKRMLSSMTPTIVEKDGNLKMVLGTPGGSTIITSVFQTIMNVVDHEMGMQEAVNANRTHSQWLPDRILIEERWTDGETIKKLEQLGHVIEYRKALGKMDCILLRADSTLEGGADYTRGDNYAEGF
ncbi:gamma-glutamyltransferase [Marinoscillum sp. MHG1-6]|uniref:gamma-glutamyltransferase n=1 Tax=Marinoscillum sp. MHG1-6 TaxID=2959627 RepID=UPI0021573A05|nr:gamma-glutamyltransferase [Marinoscillum sp. MHG1-6]